MVKILAGIVLYNPELCRLRDNIAAITPQVDKIVCVDNGSKNLGEIKEILSSNIELIENHENLGIAAALNIIMNYAHKNNYEWFITLDQDSVCMPGLIENYYQYVNLENAAILTCTIQDRNFSLKGKEISGIEEIDECITSASFCNTAALLDVGGFDEKMFIDSVDFDVCMNLRTHGYKVYKTDFVGLLHEVGNGKDVYFLWKKRVAYNHSDLRNYYMARNHVYMAKKYPKNVSMIYVLLKELEIELIILFYEENKIKKIRARHRGLIDGLMLNMGKKRNI